MTPNAAAEKEDRAERRREAELEQWHADHYGELTPREQQLSSDPLPDALTLSHDRVLYGICGLLVLIFLLVLTTT